MRKPNAVFHMILWGAGSGTILALLYIAFIIGLSGANIMDMLMMMFSLWGLGLAFGGGAGAILGIVEGFMLWGLTRNVPIPFSRGDMEAIRYKIYGTIGITTSIGGFILTTLVFGLEWFYYASLLLVFPPIIAGIAAAYVAHRYLFRLRLWSARNYGLQKEKAKNVERLEDKAKPEVTNFSEEEFSEQHETS
jgi:hypothetical protein